jgi:hypothetical protein
MIPWWGWLLIIVMAIGLGVATIPFWFSFLLKAAKWLQHLRYAREARRHNERARQLRLQRTSWMGFPLPTGKEGKLVISERDMITNPNRISQTQFDRVYRDRGIDLRVDLKVMTDVRTRDIVVVWTPHKGRWPRDHY